MMLTYSLIFASIFLSVYAKYTFSAYIVMERAAKINIFGLFKFMVNFLRMVMSDLVNCLGHVIFLVAVFMVSIYFLIAAH